MVLAAGALIGVVVIVLGRLTIEVGAEGVTAWFGHGWPRRSVPFSLITGARVVRNPIWVGWGLRWIPGGSVWNVYGRDAVELQLESGRVWRLGSDQPDALLEALAGSVPTA